MKYNIWKLYVGSVLNEMIFPAAVILPFLGSFGLSMTESILTEVIFALTIVILEIPTGYFADIYGRKKSILVGIMFTILGILFYTFGNSFIYFAIGGALWGIGVSFSSGAEEALLYETLISLDKESEYKKICGNMFFYGRISSVITSVIGGFLAYKALLYPFYATIVVYILYFILFLSLEETNKYIKKGIETWTHFITIFKESFLHNPKIRNFLIFSGILGFFSIYFWLMQKYLEFLNVPIFYFGFIIGIVPIFSGLGAKYAEKLEKLIGFKYLLYIIPIFPVLIWIIMGITKSIFIIPFMIILSFFGGGITTPIFNDYVQKLISSDRRATIMSIMSLFRRLIFTIFAPFLGWMTDIYSIQTAFLILAFMIAVFSITNFYFLRKTKII